MKNSSNPFSMGSTKQTIGKDVRKLQPKKLYITIKPKVVDVQVLEGQLYSYFADFGKLDDFKILTNSSLKRAQQALRTDFVSRRMCGR